MSGIPLVHCPVCAVELAGAIEICTTCQTPHHADCAKFVGRCAMAGCGAYEFLAIDGVEAGYTPSPPPPAAAAAGGTLPAPVLEPAPRTPQPVSRSGAVPAVSQQAPVPAIARRLGASIGLLLRNPGISIPVGVLMLLGSVLSLAALHYAGTAAWMLAQIALMFGWLIGQAVTVIMLSARARGESSSAANAIVLANQRGGRIIGTAIASGVISIVPLCMGIAMAFSGLTTLNPWLVGAGSLLTLFGFKKFVGYSLVPVIAAMGDEEEPRNALVRSTELVSTARTQAALSVVGVMFASLFVVPSLPLLVGLLLNEALALATTAYWTLFYLETRRERPE